MLELKRVVKVGELFSIYGSLLTEKQQEMVKLYYFNDLSLGEIANHKDISRQAVYDSLKRSEEDLKSYEQKLGLASYYKFLKNETNKLEEVINKISPRLVPEEIKELKAIKNRLENYPEGDLE